MREPADNHLKNRVTRAQPKPMIAITPTVSSGEAS
jgi:hypothetical protein